MTQVLARKYRPKTFAELVGQEHVVRALSNALTQQRLHHAYLFTGTRGVGKTTLARIIAKALNCETGVTAEPCGVCSACVAINAGRFVDLIELDAASNTQVDNMRELLENAMYAPTVGRYKVYIIDEVHMLSKSAFNAMLKTLEEPPAHVIFILATTDPQKIPVTVLSRCLQFNLKQIPPQQIKEQLKKILGLENISNEDEALALIARAAHGSMRDSLSLLDQAIAHGGGKVETPAVRAMLGGIEREHLVDILNALHANDGKALIAVADRMAERSLSFEAALQELASLLQRVALIQRVPDALAPDDPDHAVLSALAEKFDAESLQLYYQIALQGRQDINLAPDDYAGFTMTLLRMLAFSPETPASVASSAVKKKPDSVAPQNAGSGDADARRLSQAGSPQKAGVTEKATTQNAGFVHHDVKDWNVLVDQLKLTGIEGMLAKNSELIAWEDGRVALKVPTAQKHLADKMYQEKLRAALEKQLGRKMKVEVSIGDVAAETPAQLQTKAEAQKLSAAEAALEEDAFVRELKKNFDAHIVPSTIKPTS